MFEAIVAKVTSFVRKSIRPLGALVQAHPLAAATSLLALFLAW